MLHTYENFHSPDAETRLVPNHIQHNACMLRAALTESEKGKGHLDSWHIRKKGNEIVGTYDWGTNQIISFADWYMYEESRSERDDRRWVFKRNARMKIRCAKNLQGERR